MGIFKQLIVQNDDNENKKEEEITKVTDEKKDVPSEKIKIVNTSPNEDFWFHYGPVAKNLGELRDAFLEIDDDLYNYHAKGEVNDYAKWVREAFDEKELADKLETAKTRKRANKILQDALEN